jgi:hypothetical protein
LFGPSQKGTICSSDFLRHRITQEGLKMDDHKVKAIVDWCEPYRHNHVR